MLFILEQVWMYALGAFVLGAISAWLLRQISAEYVLRSDLPNLEDYARWDELEKAAGMDDYVRYIDLPEIKQLVTREELQPLVRRNELEALANGGALPAAASGESTQHLLRQMQTELDARDQAIAELRASLDSLREESASRAQQLQRLSDQLIQEQALVAPASAQSPVAMNPTHSGPAPKPNAELKPEPKGEAVQGELLADSAIAVEPAPEPSQDQFANDRLDQISGIGNTLRKHLNREGITSFQQIADWTGADIDAMGRRLEITADRIRREKWVEQARELHRKHHGPGADVTAAAHRTAGA